jgi:hypothetical protein
MGTRDKKNEVKKHKYGKKGKKEGSVGGERRIQ